MSDRYEIKERLGRGGIGAVHRCLDTYMERDVAIKRLLPIEETELNEPVENSLQREATALAAFQHPNVVTVFEFSEDENGPFVVTELIEGENLRTVIKTCGELDLRDFYSLVEQTLDALIAAQDMNLLHRDLKPANIMVHWLPSGKFNTKILDFGLSKFAIQASKQTLDIKGSFLGSIDFVAPEQFKRSLLDNRTDLYSIACVYYYTLTGKSPFKGKDSKTTVKKHLKHDVKHICDLRPELPRAIGDWLMNLMSRWPDDRPDTALTALRGFELAKDRGIAPMGFNFMPMQNSAENENEPEIVVTPRPEPVSTRMPHTLPMKAISGATPLSPTITKPIFKPSTKSKTPTTKALSAKKHPLTKKTALIAPFVGLACGLVLLLGGLIIFLGNPEINEVKNSPWSSTTRITADNEDKDTKSRTTPADAKISERTVAGEKP